MSSNIDLSLLTFEEEGHIYRYEGNVVPSVTHILNEWVKVESAGVYVNTFTGVSIPIAIFERAGDIGRAIHKGMKMLVEGKALDWLNLPDELQWPLSEGQRWIDIYKPAVSSLELPLYSKKMGMAGTLDFIGKGSINPDKSLSIVDFKTSAEHPVVGPQVIAYEDMYRECFNVRAKIHRYVLYLPKKEGKEFKFLPLTDDARDRYYLKSKKYEFDFRGGK